VLKEESQYGEVKKGLYHPRATNRKSDGRNREKVFRKKRRRARLYLKSLEAARGHMGEGEICWCLGGFKTIM